MDQVEALIKDGCKVVLIGLDGSPSCGIRSSGSDPRWGGKPEIDNKNYPQVPRPGIFMEVVKECIKERNLPPLKEIGAGFDMPNFDKSKISKEIEDFLRD
jgi:predicted secreted protein